FPVRVEEFAIRAGSGGPGKWSGGNGIRRRLRYLEPVIVTVLTSHRITQPFGVDGGAPGACGENWVIRKDGTKERLKSNDESELMADDQFEMLTPGGGGWGQANQV
ncbi:unnamed protein product, partial [Laminaria digitata]